MDGMKERTAMGATMFCAIKYRLPHSVIPTSIREGVVYSV